MVGDSNLSDDIERHVKRQRVYLDHKPEKVALVCMGPSATDWMTKTLTQEFDPDHVDEVWTINMATMCFRTDIVFWMDDLVLQEKFKPRLFVALRRWGLPVITPIRYPHVLEHSFDYPIQEVSNIGIPVFGKPYLNNGVAQAIGYAMWKGVKRLEIYGADFSYPNRDYAESGRACVESWTTLAAVRGMEIALSSNTSLMDMVKDQGIYGYVDQPTILMPDGRTFRYIKRNELGKYMPEDSSGAPNVHPASTAGTGRQEPSPAIDAGQDGVEHAVGADEAAAVGGPGGGLRDSNQSGWPETAGFARNGDGRGAGHSAPAAQGEVAVHESHAKP